MKSVYVFVRGGSEEKDVCGWPWKMKEFRLHKHMHFVEL